MTESAPYRVTLTVYPGLAVLDVTCAMSFAVKNATSPPTVWKLRLKPSPSACHLPADPDA
ncbi:MAG: hypothetical protein JWP76_4993 [Dactylosporangium sp.]|jgi:hypothetical protein|nr:hypothetical protein [Dactylosporangium sp.]